MPCILTWFRAFVLLRCNTAPRKAFTARFVPSMQLYRPHRKTAHRALQGLFMRLCPLNRPRYQTNTSCYNTTCATLEGIHAPGRTQPIPDTTATPGRCAGQHRPPIIIMYIRRCRGAPCCGSMPDGAAYCRPCQRRRGQRLHLHRVSPAGARCFSRPAAGGLAPGQRSGRAVWHPPPGEAV